MFSATRKTAGRDSGAFGAILTTVFAPASLFFGFPRSKAAALDRPDQCPREYKNRKTSFLHPFTLFIVSKLFRNARHSGSLPKHGDPLFRQRKTLCRIRQHPKPSKKPNPAMPRHEAKNKSIPRRQCLRGMPSANHSPKRFLLEQGVFPQHRLCRAGKSNALRRKRLSEGAGAADAAQHKVDCFSVCGAGSADLSHFCRKPYQLRTTCVIRYFFHVS